MGGELVGFRVLPAAPLTPGFLFAQVGGLVGFLLIVLLLLAIFGLLILISGRGRRW